MTSATKSTRTVLLCAAAILFLAMGVRQTMGLYLPPMTIANGCTREDFAFAIALQNLLCGAFVPFVGALADRHDAGRVLVAAAIVYAPAFIALHLPSYVQDAGMSAAVGMMALALVGFGNVFGSCGAGWLGGVIFTRQGSYDLAWWISIGLGIFAAIVCAPINERPIARVAPATA